MISFFRIFKAILTEFDYDTFAWIKNYPSIVNIFGKTRIEKESWANTSLWGPRNWFPVLYDYLIFQLGLAE